MIAILTDFHGSEYIGVMKGAILSGKKGRSAQIVDLCHTISPQNVKEGAWVLYKSYKYFPKATIFLCVVDPGVGSSRQCVAVRTKNYFFTGPDNGLLYKAASDDGITSVVKLDSGSASKTFHGRDVFAKAAAMLDDGIPIEKLGAKTTLRQKLDFHLKGREGEIARIDSFGNMITNLAPLHKKFYNIKYENFRGRLDFYETYESAPKGKLFLIEGSSATLEISIKNGSAAIKLGAVSGQKIEIK